MLTLLYLAVCYLSETIAVDYGILGAVVIVDVIGMFIGSEYLEKRKK